MNRDNCLRGGESGGVGMRALLAAVTLVAIGVLIAFMLRNAGQRQETDHRKAVGISEYGLQEALTAVQNNPSWTPASAGVPCDGGRYSVTLRRFTRNDTVMLDIASSGTMGKVTETKVCLLMRVPGTGDSLWAPQDIH